MFNRKWAYGTLIALFALSAILASIIYFQKNSNDLRVIFFDVGQGDAILVSRGGNQILIDGGKDGKLILEKLGKYIPFWDRTIEVILATHPDQDHIGGLIDVARAYKISTILETNAQSESQTYKAWKESISNIQKIEAKKGVDIKFPEGGKISVLHPFFEVSGKAESETNGNSIAAKLVQGENSFLFTGDLPGEEERALIGSQADLKSNVLKVAHHGSKYSTSEEFLAAVRPLQAIISVGKDNRYGHPAREIIDRLLRNKITIHRTDELGDIIYRCKNENEKCKVEFE